MKRFRHSLLAREWHGCVFSRTGLSVTIAVDDDTNNIWLNNDSRSLLNDSCVSNGITSSPHPEFVSVVGDLEDDSHNDTDENRFDSTSVSYCESGDEDSDYFDGIT